MPLLRAGLFCVSIIIGFTGCTTVKTSNTSRTSTEQLLISNAVDRALAKVDFRPFSGRSVYLEDTYLDAVDKSYIVATVRHQLLHAGSRVVAKPEDADIVLEIRSGGVGTDMEEMFVGVPEIAVPGPVPVSLPEIRVLSRSSQKGTAKIGLVAYHPQTRTRLGRGGVALAQADSNNWFLFGIGPFQDGSVRTEVSRQQTQPAHGEPLPKTVAFGQPHRDGQSGRMQLSGFRDDEDRQAEGRSYP